MNDIVIVCSHDAKTLAYTLQRLLNALDYNVDIYCGRASSYALETAVNRRKAVLIVWSHEALTATYIHEWAQRVDPTRLIELARARGSFHLETRKAPVLDFTTWSPNERGGAAWRALMDRLKAVARVIEGPKPPPMRAAVAMGVASSLMVGGALMVRIEDALSPAPASSAGAQAASAGEVQIFGTGGAMMAEEPASDDFTITFSHRRVSMLDAPADIALAPMPAPVEFDLRDATVLERLSSLPRALFGNNGGSGGEEIAANTP